MVRLTERPDMTIAVDRDVKHQTKPNKKINNIKHSCKVLCYLYDKSQMYTISEDMLKAISEPNHKGKILSHDANTEKEQYQRIIHIHEMCKNKSMGLDTIQRQVKTEQGHGFYVSEKYNFSYCRVAKAGSTFWFQVFGVLDQGSDAASSVFGTFRKSLAEDIVKQVPFVNLNSEERHKSRSVITARDPYSRLYSAYIDRIYLPAHEYKAKKAIVKLQGRYTTNQDFCTDEISFQQLLSAIIEFVRRGVPLNMHWTPISTICHPCDVNVISIVKMESFTSDVESFLKKIDIPDDIFEAIDITLRQPMNDRTIYGRVESIMNTIVKPGSCMNQIERARRIWISFQIQGYINEDMNFPFQIVDTEEKAANHTFLSQVIIKTAKEYPLAPEDSKLQRRRALVKAYSGINNATLQGIRDIFKSDFILFNYTDNPPII